MEQSDLSAPHNDLENALCLLISDQNLPLVRDAEDHVQRRLQLVSPVIPGSRVHSSVTR